MGGDLSTNKVALQCFMTNGTFEYWSKFILLGLYFISIPNNVLHCLCYIEFLDNTYIYNTVQMLRITDIHHSLH